LRTVMSNFVAENRSTTAVIDMHSLLCRGANCEVSAGGHPVRPDGLHLAGPGATTIAVNVLQHAIEPPTQGWPQVETISWASD
ncbi:MAG TPA: hypothetical protein PLV68_11915, partial [Ilumatobacteraceae bacterium]|nr:hypothetical protein [Ilumatobacteraceae bacterium]